MAQTLFLDPIDWDLVLDSRGDIAVASEPYALAQDAASSIRTFIGECFYDTTIGIPYFQQILGKFPIPTTLLKEQFVAAALTVPGVVAAVVFLTSVSNRAVTGQVQVTDTSGNVTGAGF